MNARSNIHSSLIALTFALSLAACSSPTLQVAAKSDLASNPVSDPVIDPVIAPDTGTVIAPVPNDPDLATTPEQVMDTPDAQTAAQGSGFGGLKTFATAAPYGNNIAREVNTDGAGNVYVAGSTTAAFGGQTFNGGSDGFLVKFNATGQLQWVRLLGTTGDEVAVKVVPSPNGSVFVAGTTNGALFSTPLDPSTLQTRADLFLAKFDTNGKRLWGKQFGSNGLDSISDMRVDVNGNAIVSGVVKNTLVGARGATGKGAFVVFASPQGALTSPRFYDVGNETPTFLKLDRALNAYVNSTTRPDPQFDLNALFSEKMTKFLADGTRQYQLSSPEHTWKSWFQYLTDSNGVCLLVNSGKYGLDTVQRFDAGIKSWQIGQLLQEAPYGDVVASQSVSNTEMYVLYLRNGNSYLLRLGAGGTVVKQVTLPSDTANNVYTYATGFNLDRSGNIFVVGSQASRDATNTVALQKPFVAKYNSSFVLQ
jgi:hypothetical protein